MREIDFPLKTIRKNFPGLLIHFVPEKTDTMRMEVTNNVSLENRLVSQTKIALRITLVALARIQITYRTILKAALFRFIALFYTRKPRQ